MIVALCNKVCPYQSKATVPLVMLIESARIFKRGMATQVWKGGKRRRRQVRSRFQARDALEIQWKQRRSLEQHFRFITVIVPPSHLLHFVYLIG